MRALGFRVVFRAQGLEGLNSEHSTRKPLKPSGFTLEPYDPSTGSATGVRACPNLDEPSAVAAFASAGSVGLGGSGLVQVRV